ncbi:hypothetical protein [Microbacterium testaceum]|uniref:hypothetical protein n=1 Tax=Microbacterium testaceum TaxID=2033 RepID=UPI002AC427A3|nr:hypothetical protein [Microbacterium testaceum]MDZ5146305.1 hypothetical protein [Microbacterium testaceum]
MADLDHLGQQLWDENYASVSFAHRCRLSTPRYEWRPVAEILAHHIEVEQVLQIERSRLYLQEVSCHHSAWDGSESRRQLQRLEDSVAARLVFHPIAPSPGEAGAIEYLGLSCAVDEWTREVGFRTPLTVASLTKLLEAGDR